MVRRLYNRVKQRDMVYFNVPELPPPHDLQYRSVLSIPTGGLCGLCWGTWLPKHTAVSDGFVGGVMKAEKVGGCC